MTPQEKLTRYLESIPEENWKLNITRYHKSLYSTETTRSIHCTIEPNVTIDVRRVDTKGQEPFLRVCFLVGDFNNTTIMDPIYSTTLLEVYNKITTLPAPNQNLERIVNILIPLKD